MFDIARADFDDTRLALFLREHLDDLAPTAPPESRHALDLDALRHPSIRMWVAHDNDVVVGTIALAELSAGHEELKSMRTLPARRGSGIATRLLEHALHDARTRDVNRVSLETGSMEFFSPARSFYRRAGFVDCPPFGSYVQDPNSVFMTLNLHRSDTAAD